MLADAAICQKIGGKLKQTRLKQNITQQSLAEAADVSLSSIKKIENGETSDIITFGQDFEVTSGVVGIPDYHSLILYVDQF